MRTLSCDNKGFTLVELLIVVALIGILSSISALVMSKQIERARLVGLTAMAKYLHQDVSGIVGNYDLAHRYTNTPYTGGKYKTDYLNGALQAMWEKGLTNNNSYQHRNPVSNSKIVLDSTNITNAFKNPAIFISYNNNRFAYDRVANNANAAGTVIVHLVRNSMQVDVYYMDLTGKKSALVLRAN